MNGCELNRWDYRRAIESLANGLPPVNGPVRQLAIGFEIANGLIQNFLSDVAAGGGAMIVKGSYGQGKTFALRCLQEIALEKNFMVAHTEVDATENRLSKPHHIYRDLIRHLHVPGQLKHGAAVLSRVTSDHLAKTLRQNTAIERARYLKQQLDCAPLTWLFSDPDILDKPALIGLLSCEPNIPIARARKTHQVQPTPQTWPAFSAGTQGDFASYLLSGIGCIAKMLGYKGLIIILDEMEKWTELNWQEQSRAGNLLGGLIWGATAEEKRVRRIHYPGQLRHSIRCGGYPFSTKCRCHLGIAIALTPRSEQDDPGELWSHYGPLFDVTLPRLTKDSIAEYSNRVSPLFAKAYGIRPPKKQELLWIIKHAIHNWQSCIDTTNRSAVQSVVASFNLWREKEFFSNLTGNFQ